MLYKLSRTWSEKLAGYSGQDAEIMTYGLEVLLSTALNICLLCLISLLLGIPDKMLLYMIAFAAMRTMAAGGYHAKNHILCFVQYAAVSLAAIYVSILCAPHSQQAVIMIAVLSIVSIFLVFKYAPVETENRPISGSERMVFKKRSRIMVLVLCLASFIFFIIQQNTYSLILSLAIFTESASLLPILKKGVVEK